MGADILKDCKQASNDSKHEIIVSANTRISSRDSEIIDRLVQESITRQLYDPRFYQPNYPPPQYHQQHPFGTYQSFPVPPRNQLVTAMPERQTHSESAIPFAGLFQAGFENFIAETERNNQTNMEKNYQPDVPSNNQMHNDNLNQSPSVQINPNLLNPEIQNNYPSQQINENRMSIIQEEEADNLRASIKELVFHSFNALTQKQKSYVPIIRKIATTLSDEQPKCVEVIKLYSSQCSIKTESTERSVMGGVSEIKTRPKKLYDAFLEDIYGHHDKALILLLELEQEIKDSEDYHLMFLISQKKGQIYFLKNEIRKAVTSFKVGLDHLNKGALSKSSEIEDQWALKEVMKFMSRCYRDLKLDILANKLESDYYELKMEENNKSQYQVLIA